jgi:hypothetical protein
VRRATRLYLLRGREARAVCASAGVKRAEVVQLAVCIECLTQVVGAQITVQEAAHVQERERGGHVAQLAMGRRAADALECALFSGDAVEHPNAHVPAREFFADPRARLARLLRRLAAERRA